MGKTSAKGCVPYHRVEPSDLGHSLNALAAHHAGAGIEDVRSYLLNSESTPEAIEQAIRDVLAERIRAACAEWGVIFVAEERVKGGLRRRLQREAGLKSGTARARRSKKRSFLDWALARNAGNPALSKNAVAEQYAKEHPGISVPSLRRYLADIPLQWVD